MLCILQLNNNLNIFLKKNIFPLENFLTLLRIYTIKLYIILDNTIFKRKNIWVIRITMLFLKQVRTTNFLTQIWHNRFLKKLMVLLSLFLDFLKRKIKESIKRKLNFLIIFLRTILLLLLLVLLDLMKIHL